MNNYINYYWELYPNTIDKKDKNYIFVINNETYYLIPYERNINELDTLVNLNMAMISRESLVHEIILNKDKKAITPIEGINYSLIRVYINPSEKIIFDDIIFMMNNNEGIVLNDIIGRTNWQALWEAKIDYFEYQIGHLIKKYPFIYKTIDYYIGLGENAILYLKDINNNSPITVSHRRIGSNSNLFDLYNPFNLIIDYKVRDIVEYIKNVFFYDRNGTSKAYNLIDNLFNKYMFDNNTLTLFYARMLFPSYYFDLYENIIENELNENLVFSIMKKSNEYERLLKYLLKVLPLKNVEWINKKEVNM